MSTPRWIPLAAMAAITGACGGDDDGGAADAAPPADSAARPDSAPAPDASLGDPIAIQFGAKVDNLENDVLCGTGYGQIGPNDATVQITDLRMYVSNLRLLDEEGAEVPITLERNAFQTANVALLDFEDSTALCAGGTGDTHTAVTGFVAPGTYTGLVFDLGVPFADNHTDVATATPPLDIDSLLVNRQVGRRFVRLDLDVNGGASSWSFHLSSMDCTSADTGTPPDAECDRPNRATYRFEQFNPSTQEVIFWLDQLLLEVDPVASDGCTSTPEDSADCTAGAQGGVFGMIGLDFATGACDNACSEQDAFTAEPPLEE